MNVKLTHSGLHDHESALRTSDAIDSNMRLPCVVFASNLSEQRDKKLNHCKSGPSGEAI